MKINQMLAPLFLLLFFTGIYTSTKAAINDLAFQEEEKTSAYTRSSYTHGIIPVPDPKKIDSASLKAGLLKMHKEAMGPRYENTDVYNNLIVHWLKKCNLMLPQNEINIIIDYSARAVYFLLGVTGAGKSTAIFALQGNQVSRGQEEESDDDDFNADIEEDNVKETDLVFKTTVQVKNPKIGHSTEGETVGAIIYYPGDSGQNVAFCDTEGFSGARSDVSEAERCISAFSPFFALKTNTIGGIIVVVSAHDILSGRGDMFKKNAHFFSDYFSAAGHTALKECMLLMITKCNKNKGEVTRQLRKMIQKSYQVYFKTLEQRAHNSDDNKQSPHINKDDKNMAALQPFFAMLLKYPVYKGAENDIKNFRFDNNNILFFDPCSEKSIKNTWKKLSSLHPFDHRHLCCFDNPLSQYLRAQILEIGDEVKQKAAPILRLQQRIKIQAAQLEKSKSPDKLQKIIDEKQNTIRKLEQENQKYKKDDSLICVFEDNHIRKLHPSSKPFYSPRVATVITGTLTVVGGVVGAAVGAAAGAAIGHVIGKSFILKDRIKIFSYSEGEPIYQIEATYENEPLHHIIPIPEAPLHHIIPIPEAPLHHITPEKSVVKAHFNIAQETNDATIKYTATAKSKSITQDKWEFKHTALCYNDANFHIKMYAKKNELEVTHKLIADKVQKIKNKKASIEESLQKQDDVVLLRDNYENNQQELQKLNSQLIREQKVTFDMLNTWAKDIFRSDSQDLVLLKSYLRDFEHAAELPTASKQQVRGQDAMNSYSSESDQVAPVPEGQLLIPANGQCLYSAVIMGYLLPVRQTPDKVTTRINQLFGGQSADCINEIHQVLENPIQYLTYLHSDAFGKLVTIFMARMQITKGTWGGPHELQTIATKLKVNIQAYYPDPSNRTNLVQADLTTPAKAISDVTLHIVRDRVHPGEVFIEENKASAKDNPHYQHYRLKYKLPSPIPVPILHAIGSPQKNSIQLYLAAWFEAAKTGKRKWLATLCDSCDININHKNEDNHTALLLGAKHGHLDCIKYLVEQGADMNDENGSYTALLYSAENGHLACVKYLVQQNADIHYKNTYGYTALVYSAQKGHLQCVKYLAEQGANIHDKNQWRYTALLLSAKYGYLDCLKYLLQQGAYIYAKNEDNNTPLILSAQQGHLACVKYLVEQGADVTVRGEDDKTALVWAINKGKKDVTNYLSLFPVHSQAAMQNNEDNAKETAPVAKKYSREKPIIVPSTNVFVDSENNNMIDID